MRWTLSVKLILGIAVIMTATMGSALLLLTINTRNLMMEDFSYSAIHLSDVADAGLENAMISRKQEEITNILQALGRREGIEGGAIFDERGEIKYSIDPKDVGRILSKDDPTCRLCHGATPKDRPQTLLLPSKQGARMMRVARPLYNQPRCQGCHRERKLGMLVIDFSMVDDERKTMAVISKQLRYTLTVAVIIIAALIGFVYLMVTRPLAHFVRIIRAINEGDLSRRMNLSRRDEIGELAASFDGMVQRINARTRELEALHAEMQRLSQTDPLTGLYNRRGLDERMQVEMLRAKRYQHPLSAIMADIDYFKNYNDVHGHLEGDVILKQIAELLRFHVRETDVVARFGGEEFLILLTETAKAEALEVAEKIRAAVSVRPFPHAGTQPEGKLTISLGVATSSADLSEARELISKADHALYVAKQAGRNRVREA